MAKAISVPRTPKSAYNPKRRVSDLLKAHITNLEAVTGRGTTTGRRRKPKTEAQASAYISELTRQLHPALYASPAPAPAPPPPAAPSPAELSLAPSATRRRRTPRKRKTTARSKPSRATRRKTGAKTRKTRKKTRRAGRSTRRSSRY